MLQRAAIAMFQKKVGRECDVPATSVPEFTTHGHTDHLESSRPAPPERGASAQPGVNGISAQDLSLIQEQNRIIRMQQEALARLMHQHTQRAAPAAPGTSVGSVVPHAVPAASANHVSANHAGGHASANHAGGNSVTKKTGPP